MNLELNPYTETKPHAVINMLAKRKRVISTDEIQFNHKAAKILLTEQNGVRQNSRTPNIILLECAHIVY